MNIENKQRIIDNLLENKFDIEKFKDFVANILNVKVRNRKESDGIYTAFLSYINTYQIISDYTDKDGKDIYIMVIKIKEEKDPVRARVKQREFVAKLLREWHRNGALVVFYNEASKQWRISFIRLSFEFTTTGIDISITPAKRLSYVVGEGEASKTAKDQFFSLAKLEDEASLSELEEVFALEKVTNDFFKEYKNKYLDIKEILIKDSVFMEEAKKHDIENPQSFAEGFAKKLMGQLAFLYFLQKKGWLGVEAVPETLNLKDFNEIYKESSENEKDVLVKVYEREDQDLFILNKEKLKKLDNKIDSEILAGVFSHSKFFKKWGTGDKKFVRNLFELHKANDINNRKTFFDDYLEVLFYNNLSKERGEGYSLDFNCRIPFLNGGLFDPYGDYNWQTTSFNLSDDIFSNKDNTGILDIFDIYNFTINENDSYETEVAVDPEMLGKVFENLLDVSDRKSKGAFYTPREIVRYMTNESIMNYLLTNLEERKVSKEDLEYLFNFGEFSKEYDQQYFEQDYLKQKKSLKDKNGKSKLDMKRAIIIHCEKIDELLKNVKIADPACGSGAFPLGILNEIVRARNVLTFYINMLEYFKEKREVDEKYLKQEFNNETEEILYDLKTEALKKNYWRRKFSDEAERTLYKLKLSTIQNCLHGVDIEPSAIDITKLRLWLSILVDSDNDNVKPLPNLDFNFMIGNSLVDEFEGMKLFDESLLNDEILSKELKKKKTYQQMSLMRGTEEIKSDILKEIFSKQAEYFKEKDSQNKKLLKKEIEELENSLIRFTLETNGQISKLEEIEKGRRERRKPYFLWKLEFAKVFKENNGFDIVIGNPPYVGEKGNKEIFRRIIDTSFGKKYYQSKYDLFYFFFHLGINLMKDNGILAFITTNYYLTADGAFNLRKDIKERTNILNLINFNEIKIFETAKGQHNLITILEKSILKNKIGSTSISQKNISLDITNLNSVFTKENTEFNYYQFNQDEFYDGENLYIRLEKDNISAILDKINSQNIKLENICYVNQGLRTGADKLTNSHIEKYGISEEKGKGIFVLTTQEYEKLLPHLNSFEKTRYKPLFKNSDITKYVASEKVNYYFLDLACPGDKEIPAEKIENIIEYLKPFKKVLEGRKETANGVLNAIEEGIWWLISVRRKLDFSLEKIIAPQRSKYNCFAYNDTEWNASADVYFITKKEDTIDLKYLLGILNSKLCYIWLYKKGKRKGDMLELYATPLEQIPVKIISKEEQEKYIQAVDRIIELKKLDKDTQELERQIDEMVYDLYELTEEEKELIRNF